MRTKQEWVQRFIKQRQKSENTIKNENVDLSQFIEYCNKQNIKEFKDIKFDDVADFLGGLVSKKKDKNGNLLPASNTTKRRKISSLTSFYNYLLASEYIIKSPMIHVETPSIGERQPKYLGLDNCYKLLDTVENIETKTIRDNLIKHRDIVIIYTFLYVGCRVAEMANLDINDVKNEKIRLVGKGNKERVVRLLKDVQDVIKQYLKLRKDNDKSLLVNYKGERLSIRSIQRIVDKYINLSGLEDEGITCHKLRHSCATLLAEGGASALEIKEILGHADVSTTQIYVHLADDTIDKAVAKNPLQRRNR